jgi:hypothetical protein
MDYPLTVKNPLTN